MSYSWGKPTTEQINAQSRHISDATLAVYFGVPVETIIRARARRAPRSQLKNQFDRGAIDTGKTSDEYSKYVKNMRQGSRLLLRATHNLLINMKAEASKSALGRAG